MSASDPLTDWFVQRGGVFDRSAIGFQDFEPSEGGRGAVALKDLEEGHTLFTIPRPLLLSTRTCSLKDALGEEAWDSLGAGWASLILCMMWEQNKGAESIWAGYLDCLPSQFSTPMFWTEQELEELKGTAIPSKIGKQDAENDYSQKILPLLTARSDLFSPDHHPTTYSLRNFHRLGSAILSRSFHVEGWKDPTQEADESMDSDSEDEAEEGEDTGDVTMVPMADMLNARFEADNARLFYEELTVSMITTKDIKQGEQIWNTYGDPPNSDLLRRYGHVDLVPLPDVTLGNPADVVEIDATLAIEVCTASISANAGSSSGERTTESFTERIDWWLEQGGDDVFVVEAAEPEIPEGLISLLRLLMFSSDDWEKAVRQSKPPKPRLDVVCVEHVIGVIEKRLAQYPTSLEDDNALLGRSSELPFNRRNAIIVRVGEKRILRQVLETAQESLRELRAEIMASSTSTENKQKRPRPSVENEGGQKRAKR